MHSPILSSTEARAGRNHAPAQLGGGVRAVVRAASEVSPAAGVLAALLVRAAAEQLPLPTGFLPALAAASGFVLLGIAAESGRQREAGLLGLASLALFAGALLAARGVPNCLAAAFATAAAAAWFAERRSASRAGAKGLLLSGWALFHATLAGLLTLGI